MFAGHLVAGLMLKRADKNAGLGTLFFAALFLDILLWVLVLAGVESVHAPINFRVMTDIAFDSP